MGTTEDELAKKQVMESVWTWTQRVIVLAVIFVLGRFTGWVSWGAGEEGSVRLAQIKTELESRLNETNKKRLDAEGKVEVLTTRIEECQKNLTHAGQ